MRRKRAKSIPNARVGMANRKARVSQADISRGLKAARSAGLSVSRFEISNDGSLKIFVSETGEGPVSNEWDKEFGL